MAGKAAPPAPGGSWEQAESPPPGGKGYDDLLSGESGFTPLLPMGILLFPQGGPEDQCGIWRGHQQGGVNVSHIPLAPPGLALLGQS